MFGRDSIIEEEKSLCAKGWISLAKFADVEGGKAGMALLRANAYNSETNPKLGVNHGLEWPHDQRVYYHAETETTSNTHTTSLYHNNGFS